MIERLLEIVTINAIVAAALAGVAAMVATRVRNPALRHALWLAVLAKLLLPPVVPMGSLLPAPPAPIGGGVEAALFVPGPRSIAAAPFDVDPDVASPRALAAPIPWDRAISGAAGAIAVLLLGVALARAFRFHREVRRAPLAGATLRRRADRLASRLGLRRAPEIRIVDGSISPALWTHFGRPLLVLPAALIPRLAPAELDTILAHELAHARRRDHWIRPFELLVVSLFWWHPVAWWARHRLRIEEERACDDAVLAALPGRGRAYADALLKTLDHLTRSRVPIPALATGAADRSRLEERLVMILKFRPTRRPSPALRAALFVAVAGILVVSPARLQGSALAATERSAPVPSALEAPSPPTPPTAEVMGAAAAAPAALAAPASPVADELLELRRQRAELEAERLRLQVEEARISAALEREHSNRQLEILRDEIASFEEQGEVEAVRALRAEFSRQEVEFEFQARRSELRAQMIERRADLESKHRRLALAVEELEIRGLGEEEIARHEAALRGADAEIERSQYLAQRRQLELQLEQLDAMEALGAKDEDDPAGD